MNFNFIFFPLILRHERILLMRKAFLNEIFPRFGQETLTTKIPGQNILSPKIFLGSSKVAFYLGPVAGKITFPAAAWSGQIVTKLPFWICMATCDATIFWWVLSNLTGPPAVCKSVFSSA
jgi:hypothetical protein